MLETSIIQGLEPTARPRKLSDGNGLFLLVTPGGGKWWRFKYRFDGKEKQLSFGTYPDVSLDEARCLREETQQQLAAGIDPSKTRQEAKARERAERSAVQSLPLVTVSPDGGIEIRKGRAMVRLSVGDARFVHKILSRLLRG